ncbi:glycosyltransferase family 2 protein [Alienimonas chondri]|uniref:Undecaprenyl-phosphate mannosyltransferase n=1 Tax=Alienimonas chondri TaxID=2681879 RepID=A0ABX1V9K5_9PLAN|nr:glycosyltransferase family 2 protein [Alienimonas chondri]NNJ24774.1 Undecaprenyl-phosphate mannosyltransferase [Alienimonas chondri]
MPVYNEVTHLRPVLGEVRRYADAILAVDDGSTDGSGPLLDELAEEWEELTVLHLPENRGYGAALVAAFAAAVDRGYDRLVTIDCDGQHQPAMIPALAGALDATAAGTSDPVDLVSGSRYAEEFAGDSDAPEDRRAINKLVTRFLNERLGSVWDVTLTDAFCGFKAYRVSALKALSITDTGYAMPLQLWVQAAAAGWNVVEYPVPRVYLEEERSFGGSLDKSAARLAHYRGVLSAELARHPNLPSEPDADSFLVLPDSPPASA